MGGVGLLALLDMVSWLRIVRDVRTILEQQEGYVHIPDLRPETLKATYPTLELTVL